MSTTFEYFSQCISCCFQVAVDQSATNNADNPNIRTVKIIITPADKEDFYKPIRLQLSIHACFELSKKKR